MLTELIPTKPFSNGVQVKLLADLDAANASMALLLKGTPIHAMLSMLSTENFATLQALNAVKIEDDGTKAMIINSDMTDLAKLTQYINLAKQSKIVNAATP